MLKIPFKKDICDLALNLSFYQDFVWLDSAGNAGVSILAFDSNQSVSFTKDSPPSDFWAFLNQKEIFPFDLDFPFCGGWIGYMCYEAFQFNDLIPLKPHHVKNYPLASFRHYDTFIIVNDKTDEKNFISFAPDSEKKWQHFESLLERKPGEKKFKTSVVTPHITKKEYEKNFKAVKKSLYDGDYLELNFTQEFSCEFSGSEIGLYLKLRDIAHAPMMGFLKFPEVTVLSASPERFFSVTDHKIETYPIKGTRKRGKTRDEDEKLKQNLEASWKDQAELLMVTDMLRSDLGRICKIGSVTVNDLAKVHTFSHYHHLISKITGELLPEIKNVAVFKALFPGGSITGAPKIKVMEHIKQLENRARGVYTGAIGYLSDNGNMDFNIPIRTITVENQNLSFATGGGIVIDSDCEAEYEECLIKATGLIEALKS